jgi:hypothetical protein
MGREGPLMVLLKSLIHRRPGLTDPSGTPLQPEDKQEEPGICIY